jgi:hypothetical protein
MAISFSRYISVTSVVGGGSFLGPRQLIGRIFTINPLLPPQSYIEFNSAAEVGAYFGLSSQEYARSAFYFSFVGKNGTSPQTLSFARWAQAATAPLIYGQNLAALGTTLATFNAVTSGSLNLTMGGFTFNLTGMDFAAAGSLAAVAAIIQAAIRAESGGGALWTGADVTLDATYGGLDLVGGATGAAAISVAPGTGGTDISVLMGWTEGSLWPNGPILSPGSAIETITQTLTNSVQASNNFGSFLFMPTFDIAQVTEAATYNLTQNNMFLYCVPVTTQSDATAYNTALLPIGGAVVTYAPLSTEFPEMVPMIGEASTNYNGINTVINYMYQQFNLTPSVADDTDANFFDSVNTNYYGVTQESGVQIAFYQRGIMSGSAVATNPALVNIYANEQWLKAANAASLMNLLLTVGRVPVNLNGVAMMLSIIQGNINQALLNGTISVGSFITPAQKVKITQLAGDINAWRQVQSIGYWISGQMQVIPNLSPTQYQFVYTLIYKKDDVVNKVVGTQILI